MFNVNILKDVIVEDQDAKKSIVNVSNKGFLVLTYVSVRTARMNLDAKSITMLIRIKLSKRS